jgi:transposase
MPIPVTITADELAALLAMREEHTALQHERDELRSMVRLVTAERDLAEERLRAYRRELFGAKSEARDSDQPGLFNEAEALGANATPAQEDSPESPVSAHTRKKRGHRKPLDPSLPREVVRHELPKAERFCTNDGQALVEFGVEISEAARCDPRAASRDPAPACQVCMPVLRSRYQGHAGAAAYYPSRTA